MSARHETAGRLRTIDHDEVREWAEARDGRPSVVAATADEGDGGILRIDFRAKEQHLEEVSWKEFFRIFDERELAFLYEEHTAEGEPSFFCKFVPREDGDEADLDRARREGAARDEEESEDEGDEFDLEAEDP